MTESGIQAETVAVAGFEEPDVSIQASFLERAERVGALGYRPTEAEFLTVVALLGGFFVQRQYPAFSGVSWGGAAHRLILRAEANEHVKVHGSKPRLYRLCGSSLFQAVGCKDPGSGIGRARRAVKQKLLVLDYWIACIGEGRLLLTADDKAAYFASLGIGEDCFPAAARTRRNKRRYFPDGFPIRVADQSHPAVRFAYAHAGSSEHGMKRHLEGHEPLARALAERGIACEWAVLADSQAQFGRLRHAWERWLGRVERDWSEGEYFALRRLVDKRRWKELSRESIERYAYLSERHGNSAATQRYREWARNGAPARKPGGDFGATCKCLEVLMEFEYSAADAACR